MVKMPSLGKEFVRPPCCPFCGLPVERPAELKTRRYGEMPVGSCSCGAVYACDVTGHNLGSAFIEALVFGCDMDWDLAWSLLPGDDYTDGLVEKYDLPGHLLVPGGFYQGRRVSGALYFVRLHRDIREATGQGVEKKLGQARAPVPGPADPPSGEGPERALTRKEVEELVADYRVEPLVAAARRDKKILRELRRLLYSGDDLVRGRAADALGQASAAAARNDPGAVSTLLQGLLNSVSAPGSSGWGALEAAGEIIYRSPGLFGGYIPMLYNFLEDPGHRPGVLTALARVSGNRPELVRSAAFRLLPCLRDPDPLTRGQAALLFGNLGLREAVGELERLREDGAEIKMYRRGMLVNIAIHSLAGEALEKIAARN